MQSSDMIFQRKLFPEMIYDVATKYNLWDTSAETDEKKGTMFLIENNIQCVQKFQKEGSRISNLGSLIRNFNCYGIKRIVHKKDKENNIESWWAYHPSIVQNQKHLLANLLSKNMFSKINSSEISKINSSEMATTTIEQHEISATTTTTTTIKNEISEMKSMKPINRKEKRPRNHAAAKASMMICCLCHQKITTQQMNESQNNNYGAGNQVIQNVFIYPPSSTTGNYEEQRTEPSSVAEHSSFKSMSMKTEEEEKEQETKGFWNEGLFQRDESSPWEACGARSSEGSFPSERSFDAMLNIESIESIEYY